jgi:hypothetical protein
VLLSLIFDRQRIRVVTINNFAYLIIVFYDVAVQVASKSLMDTLNEMYETQWVGHDHMCTDSNNLDMLWSDYTHKLADQVLIPLNTYQAQFAETRVSDIFLTNEHVHVSPQIDFFLFVRGFILITKNQNIL